MNIDNIAKHRTMGSILLSIERFHMLDLRSQMVNKSLLGCTVLLQIINVNMYFLRLKINVSTLY